MNLICLIVYNRVDNIKHWLHCWKQCEHDAHLVVIHNMDTIEPHELQHLCDVDSVTYIQRQNIGFDIGAFQDVCIGRLQEMPNWDNILWITDDTFPMQKDFAVMFWDMLSGTACVAMEISPYVREHIRTTGFAISKEVAQRLTFPVDPITTKEECYAFEHRTVNHMLQQIKDMGLNAVMVAPRESSQLFDTGYHRRVKERLQEHYNIFGREQSAAEPLVSFICPAYNSYPFIINSLLQQTHQNWKLYLIHDGPNETGIREQVERFNDDRIVYSETTVRSENWGHTIRSEWLHKVEGEYVVITNQDNYHTPVFIEYMLRGFKDGIIATYCSDMVHSYKAWQIIPCSLRRGYLDCAGVMMRTKDAQLVGWHDVTSHSADWFFFEALIKKYGAASFAQVKGCLLIHN